MKTTQAKSEVIEEIVATLRRVPQSRLRVVRDLVSALAVPQEMRSQDKARARKKVSLVETPFCGMWEDREDITNEQAFARQLRVMVEARGDRGKNIR